MKTRKLQAGSGTLGVTVLGFGGAPLGKLYTAISDDQAEATLDAAWNIPPALWSDVKSEGLLRPDAPVPTGSFN